MSDLKDLLTRAKDIRKKYEELNAKEGKAFWEAKDYAMGFVGDVGDLIKLVMAKENLRTIEDTDAKLAHELADCLWSTLIMASHYGIDLEKEFLHTMDDIEKRITEAHA
jgi:NTP pyrophosphatase (non-canonical NTP hydrolase)